MILLLKKVDLKMRFGYEPKHLLFSTGTNNLHHTLCLPKNRKDYAGNKPKSTDFTNLVYTKLTAPISRFFLGGGAYLKLSKMRNFCICKLLHTNITKKYPKLPLQQLLFHLPRGCFHHPQNISNSAQKP